MSSLSMRQCILLLSCCMLFACNTGSNNQPTASAEFYDKETVDGDQDGVSDNADSNPQQAFSWSIPTWHSSLVAPQTLAMEKQIICKDCLSGIENLGSAIEFADINGDGHLDIVNGNSYGLLDWYQNDGANNFNRYVFDNKISFYGSYGSSPYLLNLTDIDGDGDIDFLLAKTIISCSHCHFMDSDFIVLYKNTGNGTFIKTVINSDNIGSAGIFPISMIDLDYDSDGDSDVLVTTERELVLFENNGSNNFSKKIIYDINFKNGLISSADLNHNSNIDIITAGKDGINWYENKENGGFTQHHIDDHIIDGSTYNKLMHIDINEDGWMDLIVINSNDRTLTQYLNNADGNFTKQLIAENINTEHIYKYIDFNNDANNKLLFVNDNVSDKNIYTLQPAIHFDIIEGNSFITNIKAADADGNSLSYAIDYNRDDAALFEIDPKTGQLSFKTIAIASQPKDYDADNQYLLTITASDGFNDPISLFIAVQVTIDPNPLDSDQDGVVDFLDAFPNDALESIDSDGDGLGNNADLDDDNDGTADNQDAFPLDPNENKDIDQDGVGDNADAFPFDASETIDTDQDGVGDNSDVFPNDKNETQDSDNDGVGDNADAFPNYALETKDSDNDGVGNNADAFPQDASETKDSDSDGIGDNTDSHPFQINSWTSPTWKTQSALAWKATRIDQLPEAVNTMNIQEMNADDSINIIARADMDGDGDMDKVSASYVDHHLTWQENLRTVCASVLFCHPLIEEPYEIIYEDHSIKNTLENITVIKATDVDNDGDMDIIIASNQNNTIAWYENNGKQHFTQHIISNQLIAVNNIHLIDIDNDGHLDLLATSKLAKNIVWYKYHAPDKFSEQIITINNADYLGFAVSGGDLDQDGDTDLLTSVNINNEFIWLENNGLGEFTEHKANKNLTHLSSLTVGNFNNDGNPTLLTTSYKDEQTLLHQAIFQFNVYEGNSAIGKLMASDIDGNQPSYAISEGIDANLIEINSITGALSFKHTPAVNAPLDMNADKIYEFTVIANDGYGGLISRQVEVHVILDP